MAKDGMLTTILDALEIFQDRPRLLITIDGPCGSGKSTLAARLSTALDAPVVHLDDFSIPHAQKTADRLSIPGGNLDIERFCTEVLDAWLAGDGISYRPYDCHADALAAPVKLPKSRTLIFEGSYVNLPEIAKQADLRIFLTVSPETQQKRLRGRVGPERLAAFNSRWIPLEQAHFRAYGLPDSGCLCLDADQDTDV